MSDQLTERVVANLPLPRDVKPSQKFGQLTVVDRLGNDASKRIRLRCQCDCGKECAVRLSDLRSGHTKSCGCLRQVAINRKFDKLQFRQFGSLSALGKAEEVSETRPSTKWVAVCRFCPKIVMATTSELRKGKKRCSCLDGTYSSWRNMIQRCTNPKFPQYKDYGGRGIKVCDAWLESFQKFVSDMGRRPEGTTLDRVDPNENYCQENCRWADAKEQANNRRTSR